MAYTTIKKPSSYFNTKIFTGTGATNSVTGVGFQPDWTWIKNRSTSASNHRITDAVRGVTKEIYSDVTAAEGTNPDGLTVFGSDGFTVGSNADYNGNGNSMVSWNWLANNTSGSSNTDGSITSTVSANTTSGFSIVSYTGIGNAATVGHGLGAIPKMIITKRRNGADSWSIYHAGIASDAETDVIYFETGAAFDNATFWNDTAPTSSVFSVGSASSANPFIAYCFAEKQGFSKFGSYTGNGNADGTFVYTGFKPAFIITKPTANISSWNMTDVKRSTYNDGSLERLKANTSDAETSTSNFDILSNGFKLRTTDNDYNPSGLNVIYMAFAEEPLVGDNPATAR